MTGARAVSLAVAVAAGAAALAGCGQGPKSMAGAGGAGTGGAGTGGAGAGGAGTGGATDAGAGGAGAGGATGGADGATGGTTGACKRGIATNTPPGPAFSGAIRWWYNWSLTRAAAGPGVEFVPMAWGATSAGGTIPVGSAFVLGFNEPNFHAQSNLTPQQAAAAWATLQSNATRAAASIVSPAMNFCGPASSCNGTDPYQYLKDFFADCAGCEVDYVAVHWYNCDLPSLRDYLEPGGSLEGFEQFGKPIWLTEFSCGTSASVAQQEAYMRAAIPYLEANPKVFRYSWFSADPIPNAKLVNPDGSPTTLGQVYASLPQTCPSVNANP